MHEMGSKFSGSRIVALSTAIYWRLTYVLCLGTCFLWDIAENPEVNKDLDPVHREEANEYTFNTKPEICRVTCQSFLLDIGRQHLSISQAWLEIGNDF